MYTISVKTVAIKLNVPVVMLITRGGIYSSSPSVPLREEIVLGLIFAKKYIN